MATEYSWQRGPFRLIKTPRLEYPDQASEPQVELATLMALIHNCWIRALNGLYVTAPHVRDAELSDFLGYAGNVYAAIQSHHDEEESFVFPLIAEKTGIDDIMVENVEQHRAFDLAFHKWVEYVSSLRKRGTRATFSAQRFTELMDGFREPLQIHLEHEVITLLGLGKHVHLDITQLQKEAHEQTLAHMKFTQLRDNMPVVLLNHDSTYEGGVHGMWPPMPPGMHFTLRRLMTLFNWGYWKFATCDTSQRPQEPLESF